MGTTINNLLNQVLTEAEKAELIEALSGWGEKTKPNTLEGVLRELRRRSFDEGFSAGEKEAQRQIKRF